MTSDTNIQFPGQDQIRKDFLQYVQLSPISNLAKDLIITYADELQPILLHPPIECFLKNGLQEEMTWKSLCLCSAYSVRFLSLFEKYCRENLHFDWLAKILMIECQRLCGHLFELKHAFWATFYQNISPQYYYHSWPGSNPKNKDQNSVYPRFSVFLLPLDTLTFHLNLSPFQHELLNQSMLATCRGFYNVEKKNLTYQKKLFKNALLYSKDMTMTGYDRWINYYADLIIHSKTENS